MPNAALSFRCPTCETATVLEGIKHVVAIGNGVRIGCKCQGCKQAILLGPPREEKPLVVVPHLKTGGPATNRQARRMAEAQRRHKKPLIIT